MVALDLEHGRAVEHALEGELLLGELEVLEAAGHELHEDVAVVLGDQVDDVEALHLALHHQDVLLRLDHHLRVVRDLVALTQQVQQVRQDLLHLLLRVPEAQVDRLPQEAQQGQQDLVLAVVFGADGADRRLLVDLQLGHQFL